MTDSERLEILIKYLKKERIVRNQQDFVERIKDNPTVVSSYKSGKRTFSEIFIRRVHETFPFISIDWLRNGTGEMIRDTEQNFEKEALDPYYEKIATAIQKIADSSFNVSEANKILASTNAELVAQVTVLLEEMRASRNKTTTYERSPDIIHRASDHKGEYEAK